MMEKCTPHCKLNVVKALLNNGQVRITQSALFGAEALGFDYEQMIEVIATLSVRDFSKSMTTYADHRIWQDVYKPMTSMGAVYLKLTVIDDLLIVSFKEL